MSICRFSLTLPSSAVSCPLCQPWDSPVILSLEIAAPATPEAWTATEKRHRRRWIYRNITHAWSRGMQLLFCLLLKSAIKSPVRFDLDTKQGKMCHSVENRKRFRSSGPSHIMEAKQKETVDLEMTSPARAPLPDAQCREYLFSDTWQG